jgi:hypothetical protein
MEASEPLSDQRHGRLVRCGVPTLAAAGTSCACTLCSLSAPKIQRVALIDGMGPNPARHHPRC